jgi:hypothetical protein
MTTKRRIAQQTATYPKAPRRHEASPVPGLNKHAEIRHPWYLAQERIITVDRPGAPANACTPERGKAHHWLCGVLSGIEAPQVGYEWQVCRFCGARKCIPLYSTALYEFIERIEQ